MMVREFGTCDEVLGNQYALSLYTLAESVRATDILEIGAGWGWSARAFAASLENRPGGTLTSIDPYPRRIHKENRDVVNAANINWTIVEGSSATVEIDGEFDLVYIDGNPYMAQSDFLRFYWKLRPAGLIVMDGYGGQVGPTEAVDSLSSSYHFTILPYKANYCHAIHSKPVTLGNNVNNRVSCSSCGTLSLFPTWRDADTAANDHSGERNHSVAVHIESRNLSYTVFQKGAP